jgi:hypothetical protein
MNLPNPRVAPRGLEAGGFLAVGIRPESIELLLTCLLGREVTVRRSAPAARRPLNAPISGVYREDLGSARAVFSLDIGLAAHAAAALTLIPSRVAVEAATARVLPDMLRENVREILNVCAQLLNDEPEHHVALREVCVGPILPQDVVDAVNPQGLDLDVVVGGYGGGRLVLRALKQAGPQDA